MRILFDQGTPAPLRDHLPQAEVATAYELGWSTLKNGKYQQNLSARTIAIVVLSTTSWPRIRSATANVVEAVFRAAPGTYEEVSI